MKKVIITVQEKETIFLHEIADSVPIFAVQNEVVIGMLVHETNKGWLIRTKGIHEGAGYHEYHEYSKYHRDRKSAIEGTLEVFPEIEFYIGIKIND